MIEIIVMACLIGLFYCVLFLGWTNRVGKKYVECVDIPWKGAIDSLKTKTIEELNEMELVFGKYRRLAELVLSEYDRFNPIYWVRYWNHNYTLNDIS